MQLVVKHLHVVTLTVSIQKSIVLVFSFIIAIQEI